MKPRGNHRESNSEATGTTRQGNDKGLHTDKPQGNYRKTKRCQGSQGKPMKPRKVREIRESHGNNQLHNHRAESKETYLQTAKRTTGFVLMISELLEVFLGEPRGKPPGEATNKPKGKATHDTTSNATH